MRRLPLVVCLFLCAGPALSDLAAAQACEAALSPLGQDIYAATLAQDPTPATARGMITKEVERLVAEGKTTISEGRTAAEAAGKCLEMLE